MILQFAVWVFVAFTFAYLAVPRRAAPSSHVMQWAARAPHKYRRLLLASLSVLQSICYVFTLFWLFSLVCSSFPGYLL